MPPGLDNIEVCPVNLRAEHVGEIDAAATPMIVELPTVTRPVSIMRATTRRRIRSNCLMTLSTLAQRGQARHLTTRQRLATSELSTLVHDLVSFAFDEPVAATFVTTYGLLRVRRLQKA